MSERDAAAVPPLGLPELRSSLLAPETVRQFFADLALETTVLQISLKGGEAEGTAGRGTNLRMARDSLLSGAVTGVQIRYVHERIEWWDTLMRTGEGIRIVRVRK